MLCWAPGSAATHVLINTKYCIKLPDSLSFDRAVTLSTAHAAMIRGLKELCNLAHGESILIHSAAGTDGIAAIQIARMIGATVGYLSSISEPQTLIGSYRSLSLPQQTSRAFFWRQIMESQSLIYSPPTTILLFWAFYRAPILEGWTLL